LDLFVVGLTRTYPENFIKIFLNRFIELNETEIKYNVKTDKNSAPVQGLTGPCMVSNVCPNNKKDRRFAVTRLKSRERA